MNNGILHTYYIDQLRILLEISTMEKWKTERNEVSKPQRFSIDSKRIDCNYSNMIIVYSN